MIYRFLARAFFWMLAAVLLIVAVALPAIAQQETLAYSDRVLGTLTASVPSVTYSFTGTAGDLVTVRTISLTAELQLAVSIISANGDLFTNAAAGVNSSDNTLSLRLARSGSYQLRVGAVNTVEGDFVLLLDQIETGAPTALRLNETIDVTFQPDDPAQAFTWAADGSSSLTIITVNADFSYGVWLLDQMGMVIFTLDGKTVQDAALNFAVGSGSYELILFAHDLQAEGAVTVRLTAAGQAAPTASATIPADICAVSPAAEPINARSAPSPIASIVGVVQLGMYAEVTARSETGWYRVIVDGQVGWVTVASVTITGNCRAIPYVDAPPPLTTEEASGLGSSTEPPAPVTTEAADVSGTNATPIATATP